MKLTDNQLNKIWWKLYEAEQNERIVKGTGEDSTWFRKTIDKQTASDIIDLFEQGQWKSAISQLNHLGAKIELV